MPTKSTSPTRASERPPTTSVLRSAIYYQNRIFVQKPKPPVKAGSQIPNDPDQTDGDGANTRDGTAGNGNRHNSSSNRATGQPSSPGQRISDSAAVNRTLPQAVNANAAASTQVTASHSSDRHQSEISDNRDISDRTRHSSGGDRTTGTQDRAMSAQGIDIVITDADGENEPKPSCLKRFYLCLQDNRMEGKPNAEQILAKSNPADFKVLKKVLNVTFLTVGIALLIAVIIVIIYSGIVGH